LTARVREICDLRCDRGAIVDGGRGIRDRRRAARDQIALVEALRGPVERGDARARRIGIAETGRRPRRTEVREDPGIEQLRFRNVVIPPVREDEEIVARARERDDGVVRARAVDRPERRDGGVFVEGDFDESKRCGQHGRALFRRLESCA
jgi:hypothetical protein